MNQADIELRQFLNNFKTKYPDFKGWQSAIDELQKLEEKKVYVEQSKEEKEVSKIMGKFASIKTYDDIEPALNSREGNNDPVIFANKIYAVFEADKDYKTYFACLMNKFPDEVTRPEHSQIIKSTDVQNLIFIFEESTDAEMKELEQYIIKEFSCKSDDIKSIKHRNSYVIILASVIGTLDQNKLKILNFQTKLKSQNYQKWTKITPPAENTITVKNGSSTIIHVPVSSMTRDQFFDQDQMLNPVQSSVVINITNNFNNTGDVNIANTNMQNGDHTLTHIQWITDNPPGRFASSEYYDKYILANPETYTSIQKFSSMVKAVGYIQKKGTNNKRYWIK